MMHKKSADQYEIVENNIALSIFLKAKTTTYLK